MFGPSEDRIKKTEARLTHSLSEVTEHAVELARKQMELAKAEAVADLTSYTRQTRVVLTGVGLILVGFAFFNLGLVLLAGYLGGIFWMMIASFLICILYVAGGAILAYLAFVHIRAQDAMFNDTKREFRRSLEWVKQIATF